MDKRKTTTPEVTYSENWFHNDMFIVNAGKSFTICSYS